MEVDLRRDVNPFNLNYIEDLLEEFKNRRLDVTRKFFKTSSAIGRVPASDPPTTQLRDIVDWLQEGQSAVTPLPAWKEHLIQLYVKTTVESYFNGEKGTISEKKIPEKKEKEMNSRNKVERKAVEKKVEKPLRPSRPSSVKVEPPKKSRIIRGKVERFEPITEKKIKIPVLQKGKPNPRTGKIENNKTTAKVEIQKDKSAVVKRRNQPVKKNIEEESRVDNLWKEIFARNNLNDLKEIKTHKKDLQEEEIGSTNRPISPLIPPNVSISPRKFLKSEELNHLEDPPPQPVSQFNIDKFLSKLKEVDCQRESRRLRSPVASEVSSSFTYPVRSSSSPSDNENVSLSTPEKRLQKIKKSLLDLESPPTISSSNSTICRVLDDCFDTYERQDNCTRKSQFASNFTMTCCAPCSDSWRLQSSPLSHHGHGRGGHNTSSCDLTGITPLQNVEMKFDKTCQTEEVLGNYETSTMSSRSSRIRNEKEMQRLRLESDPKVKRVIDDIRKESDEVLRRNSRGIVTGEDAGRDHYRDPYYNQQRYGYICGYDGRHETIYKTCCTTTSLSTGISELELGSDFTDVNSDVLICPSSSNWDSL